MSRDIGYLVLIMATGLILRFGWVLLFQTPPVSDSAQYDGLAWRLATGYGYVTPGGTPTAY